MKRIGRHIAALLLAASLLAGSACAAGFGLDEALDGYLDVNSDVRYGFSIKLGTLLPYGDGSVELLNGVLKHINVAVHMTQEGETAALCVDNASVAELTQRNTAGGTELSTTLLPNRTLTSAASAMDAISGAEAQEPAFDALRAIREAEAYMHRNPETMLFVVGERGRQYCQNKKIPIVEEFHYSAAFPTVWEARKICTDLLEYYDAGQLDEIDIIYTEYQNGKPAQCQRNCLLPLERSQLCPTLDEPPQTGKEFFPDPDTVLEGIIPSYLTGFIYSCLVDSYCSEQEARMTAMSSAGKNAEEILKKLQMQYNSLRQAAITREMVEITSGAKALKRKREKN